MRNKQGNRPDQLWTTILPERSDITWAGPHDVVGQFCLGTENGSVFWTNESGKLISGLSAASRDREAINGVAFNARDMVVTTRSDCCYWTRPQLGSVLQKITGEQFGYGSHGVVNGINNDFFLPCGHNGMMRLSRTKDHSPNSWIVSSDDADINCYSVASFEGSDGDQLIASALRKTGIAVGKVDIANPISLHTMSITSDDDFINFSIIGGDKTPNSAYALTRDGTIFLYNNICQPDLFSAANFKELVRGSYQRILVVGNYTFVLSSDGLLNFKHFFVRSGHNIIPNSIINYAVY